MFIQLGLAETLFLGSYNGCEISVDDNTPIQFKGYYDVPDIVRQPFVAFCIAKAMLNNVSIKINLVQVFDVKDIKTSVLEISLYGEAKGISEILKSADLFYLDVFDKYYQSVMRFKKNKSN